MDQRNDEERNDLEPDERPLFLHPQWMVGVVMVFAMIAAVAGLDNPIWWMVGSPFFVVFVLVIWVRLRPGRKSD